MELQIQDLVSSIKKDGIDSANQQAAAILADEEIYGDLFRHRGRPFG